MKVPHHRSAAELLAGVPEILKSPAVEGTVAMIVVRPDRNLRELPQSATLTPEDGVAGDRWARHCSRKMSDGSLNPDTQITLWNQRTASLVAGDRELWPLAGDNLVVDLDLSLDNLPPGQRVLVGEAVLEITLEPHTGCSKFSKRFGQDALAFVNSVEGKKLRLRGVNTRVIKRGRVQVGDRIKKLLHPPEHPQ